MQAFIKEDKLIVNTQILDDEREKLLEFIDKAESKGVYSIPLYNIEGNRAGIAFQIKEEVEK